ncbi:MAG: hypothetical protein NT104_02905 [Bacteroidetes bacterium]|nr:hypothetical protein [Bacteroidota bacterium]
MKLLSPRSMFFLLLLIAAQTYGQAKEESVIKENINTVSQTKIGSLICSIYTSNEVKNSVQIIFKNQKYIYQQESDTIAIADPVKINQLIKDLKEGLSIIEDDQKTASFDRGYYIIVKDNIFMDNKVLTFWNKDYNIGASINKSSITQLIEWLEAIKF